MPQEITRAAAPPPQTACRLERVPAIPAGESAPEESLVKTMEGGEVPFPPLVPPTLLQRRDAFLVVRRVSRREVHHGEHGGCDVPVRERARLIQLSERDEAEHRTHALFAA